jgi:hypothetical protein
MNNNLPGDGPKSERGLMRQVLVATIVLGSLLSSHLSAQRSSRMARGGAPVHFVGSELVPPLHGVVPPLGSTRTGFRGNFFRATRNCFRGNCQFGSPFWGYSGYGYGGCGYGGDFAGYPGDYGEGSQAQAQPNVVVVAPQMAMPPLLATPPPPRAEIRDYNWPASSSSSHQKHFPS